MVSGRIKAQLPGRVRPEGRHERELAVAGARPIGIDGREIDLIQLAFVEVADRVARRAGVTETVANGIEIESIRAYAAGEYVGSRQPLENVIACSPGQHVIEGAAGQPLRSEEHTSELQSLAYLVCRLL